MTSLVKYFSTNALATDIGDFLFLRQIGQGGNALVYSFKKGESQFAIKFIGHTGDAKKLARFKDEFFCSMQIETHSNIARAYHFDTVEIEGSTFSLIVMKLYAASLAARKGIPSASDDEKAEHGWALFRALASGLNHLHDNEIVHRDIKPQNIFFDEGTGTYVIGDLGIAHFSDEEFAREAKTKEGERLSNYLFSAPEQADPKVAPHPTWDIYALGQVLNWYLYDEVIRGGGRKRYRGKNTDLAILDTIIDRCLQNSPADRFQSIAQLAEFEDRQRTPRRDIFRRLYELDEAFRSSIPKIQSLYSTTDKGEISRLLVNFSKMCDMDEFWYIKSDGGDFTLMSLSSLGEGRCLLHDHYELIIEKLICYRHTGLHRSFFILLTAADQLFDLSDFDGNPVDHPNAEGWPSDTAVLYDGKYINPVEVENGYFEHNGQVHPVDRSKMHDRERLLLPDAFMITPIGTGPSSADWTINRDFLTGIMQSGNLLPHDVNSYLRATRQYIDPEILQRL